jgi:hypothetical protein
MAKAKLSNTSEVIVAPVGAGETTAQEPVHKVINIFLHGALIWSGVSGGDKTINDTKFKGIDMTWKPSEQAVRIKIKGREAIIPIGSINSFEIAALLADNSK